MRTLKHLAAAAVTASIILVPSVPVHADALRTTGSVNDPVGDTVITGDANAIDKRAFDISSLTARSRLSSTGGLSVEAVIKVGDAERLSHPSNDQARLSTTFVVDGPGTNDYTAVATTYTAPKTGFSGIDSLTINGKNTACRNMRVLRLNAESRFLVSVPLTCLPSGGKIKAKTTLNVPKSTTGRTIDSTAFTSVGDLSYAGYRAETFTEALGDVYWPQGDPAVANGAGRSVDMVAADTTYLPASQTLRTRVQVLDLSVRRYDPAQQFEVALHRGDGTVLGRVHFGLDRTGAGKHVAAADGLTCTGAKVAAVHARASIVVLDIPRACAGSNSVVKIYAAAALISSGVVARDATPTSDLISLR